MKEITEKDGQKAFDLHQDILFLKKQMGVAFVTMGGILKKIRDDEHYLVLGYDTFVSYLENSELSFKRRTAYYYIEIYEWFIEKLNYQDERLAEIGYEKLVRLLPVVKKAHQNLEYPKLKDRVEQFVVDIKELRPVDFNKKYKDDNADKGYEKYLAPPEYYRCDECGKWVIVVPIEDCCKDFLKDFKRRIRK